MRTYIWKSSHVRNDTLRVPKSHPSVRWQLTLGEGNGDCRVDNSRIKRKSRVRCLYWELDEKLSTSLELDEVSEYL